MNINNKDLNLLGLYFISPDCKLDEYCHAYSFSMNNLENILKMDVPENEKKYYLIKPIILYKCIRDINNNSYLIEIKDISEYEIYKESLYAYNKIELVNIDNIQYEICKHVLLFTKNISNKMIENGISKKYLEIDKFYEESIINV